MNAMDYGATGSVLMAQPMNTLQAKPLPKLYQVAYRSRLDGTVITCNGYNDLDTAEAIVRSFNLRYGQDYEYFIQEVNLKSLSERQLLELMMAGKLNAIT